MICCNARKKLESTNSINLASKRKHCEIALFFHPATAHTLEIFCAIFEDSVLDSGQALYFGGLLNIAHAGLHGVVAGSKPRYQYECSSVFDFEVLKTQTNI